MSTPSTPTSDKPATAHLDHVDTKDVEANAGTSLEKTDTAKTVNDVNTGFILAMVGFSLTFVVAEITPLFLITVFTVIAYDVDAAHYIVWILVSQLIAVAAISPFVGALSDAFGRKNILLFSLILTIVGQIVLGTAHHITATLIAQVLLGLAIGIQLLSVIAAVTELVPTSQRGITIGYIVCGLVPFAPASLYGQYIASTSWRYITALLGGCAAIAFVILAFFYHPPPQKNELGLTVGQQLARLDYLGGFLSTAGMVVFLTGLNWGGQDYAWHSAHVISTLTIGIALWVVFFVWEKFGAKHPLFPMRIVANPRLFISISILCLTSGVNYIPVVVFWVVQSYTVYEASFKQAGVYLLPIGFCIIGGAIISAVLISIFPKRINLVLALFCILQTAGLGSMAAVDPENLNTVWAPLCIGLIGVGGVLLPSQVIFSIITPDDLIGTGVALSVVIRLVGQVIGVSMFYNIFVQQVTKSALKNMVYPAVAAGLTTPEEIRDLVTTLSAGPFETYAHLFPTINTTEKIASIVVAGHETYKSAFPLLYLIAIAFGCVAFLASFGLTGLDRYITENVAVLL